MLLLDSIQTTSIVHLEGKLFNPSDEDCWIFAAGIVEFSKKTSCCYFMPTGHFQADNLLGNQRVIGANVFHTKNGTISYHEQEAKKWATKLHMQKRNKFLWFHKNTAVQ